MKLKVVEKIDGYAIGTLVTGMKVLIQPEYITIGTDTRDCVRTEDATQVIICNGNLLDSEGNPSGETVDLDLRIRTKASIVGTTDYMSDQAKEWLVDEVYNLYNTEEVVS